VLLIIYMVINKELLEARKKIFDRRPNFVRLESWRYDRLAESWRKPRGKDNKMRKQVSGVPRLVKIGYRGPRIARGLHPSGYTDNIVFNINDLSYLDPGKDAVRIAHVVGARKRAEIISKAASINIKVLNPGKEASKNKEKEKLEIAREAEQEKKDVDKKKEMMDEEEEPIKKKEVDKS
jgi:large subunit ribosomal protein L32e